MMIRTEIICQGYKCSVCKHELELKKEKHTNVTFNKLIECPHCGDFMSVQPDRWRTEFQCEDPSDDFGGYLFDDREPF